MGGNHSLSDMLGLSVSERIEFWSWARMPRKCGVGRAGSERPGVMPPRPPHSSGTT